MAEATGLIPLSDEDVCNLLDGMRQKALGTDQKILVREVLKARSLTCRQAGILLETVKTGLMQRMLALEVFPGRLSDLPDGLPYILEPLSGNIRRDVEAKFDLPNGNAIVRERSSCLFSLPSSASLSRDWRNESFHWKPREGDVADDAAVEESAPDIRRCQTMPEFTSANRWNDPVELTKRWEDPVERIPPSALIEPLKLDSFRSVLSPCRSISEVDRRKPNWAESVERLRGHVTNGELSGPLYEDLAAVFEALGLPPLPAQMDPDDLMQAVPEDNSPSREISPRTVPLPDLPQAPPYPEPPGTSPPVHVKTGATTRKERPLSGRSTLSEESV